MKPAKQGKQASVSVPEGGLLEFYLNRGWVVYCVIHSPSYAALDAALKDARKHGGKALLVWRDGSKTVSVIRRESVKSRGRTRT